MIVAGDHMLGPEINKRNNLDSGYFLYVTFVTLGDRMRQNRVSPQHQASGQNQQWRCDSAQRVVL